MTDSTDTLVERVREIAAGIAEQQAMPDDWWQEPLNAALTELAERLEAAENKLNEDSQHFELLCRKEQIALLRSRVAELEETLRACVDGDPVRQDMARAALAEGEA